MTFLFFHRLYNTSYSLQKSLDVFIYRDARTYIPLSGVVPVIVTNMLLNSITRYISKCPPQ